jgi:hypothetical protein
MLKGTQDKFIIVCLYVDDLLITRSNINIISYAKKLLVSTFDIKDMEVGDVILRIKILRTSEG